MGDKGGARSTRAPGTRFGRYEVVTDIASGGMATVYLARALGAAGFQRLVAIKLMHPHYADDEDFVAMFMDEARLAARIRHPNVVATLDLENDDDGLYLVMEYVEGDVLLGLLRAARAASTTIPPGVALRIALDALNGLHAAHELTGDGGEPLRLVHRDISPHNILVGVDGIARITDFGIARAETRDGTTRAGHVKGKLSYMAPEQTQGAVADRRSDVFATGVVLWECLTGKRLFDGSNDGEVLRKLVVNPIPKLREVRPELPASLEAVVTKALEREPDDRWASASQFADALEDAAGAVGIASPRGVSQHVRNVSGAKIAAMEKRVWGLAPLATNTRAALRVVPLPESVAPARVEPIDSLDLLDETRKLDLAMTSGAHPVAPPAGHTPGRALPPPLPPNALRATMLPRSPLPSLPPLPPLDSLPPPSFPLGSSAEWHRSPLGPSPLGVMGLPPYATTEPIGSSESAETLEAELLEAEPSRAPTRRARRVVIAAGASMVLAMLVVALRPAPGTQVRAETATTRARASTLEPRAPTPRMPAPTASAAPGAAPLESAPAPSEEPTPAAPAPAAATAEASASAAAVEPTREPTIAPSGTTPPETGPEAAPSATTEPAATVAAQPLEELPTTVRAAPRRINAPGRPATPLRAPARHAQPEARMPDPEPRATAFSPEAI